ncbi:hypothetical protein SERLA73DRAFT_177482 [Serpula lacrymans var. lacrymans S7.3]|uniref:BHLH domain-containing protein n=1 Tax=Serpula lacrymans var. lacrymans (strain S7.3) TaxID=936435 RepID=F8PP14_SERL3|nr:hypothetical protein SERLA73DRAFT_177482 [Serpula lacrymans var. lacrymans S7.3]
MPPNPSPPSHDMNANHPDSTPRPASNYVFGSSEDVTNSSEPINKQMRKILRSPSTERDVGQILHAETDASPRALSSPTTAGPAGSNKTNTSDQMDIDTSDKQSPRIHVSMEHGKLHPSRQQEDIEYDTRRQSLTNPDSPYPQGTKRKMSSDRAALGGDDVDPQLVGPGIPSGMGAESEGRASKRRGSAVETQRIAHLSLYDRRNSVDSRLVGSAAGHGPNASIASPLGNGPQWWINDRRDSSSSMFSNGSGGGYSSAFSAESPHGRAPAPPAPGSMATFAWATAQHPENDQDPNAQNHPRPFESQALHIPMMPPMNFAADRRMSVPDNTPSAVGPTRTLRSRSRPPSRQMRGPDQANSGSTGPSSGQEEPSSAPSPSSSLKPLSKEAGNTPYSRSPELRVSHKLAERKRRKEMKDLFDELRDQLPADRGMKASKWEILSKAIDFVGQLKQSHQDMVREIEMLRHELDSMRQGIPSFGPGGPPHAVVYGQGPVVPAQYPHPQGAMPHAPPHPHQPPHPPLSRPASSQNAFPPGSGPTTHAPPPSNGNSNNVPMNRTEAPPT